MAHVILGLLLLAPRTLYDLVKAFGSGISLFYSASSGSLKRALDGLLDAGLIEVESVEAGARGRKVYAVTDAGVAEFHRWMTGELLGDLETEALARLYFLGLLDPGDRADSLDRIRSRMTADLTRLETLAERLDAADIPAGLEDVAAYQRATLDYGLASHRHAITWFDGIG